MDEPIIRQLNQRIDEHYAYLIERLGDLRTTLESGLETIATRLDAHEAYHRAYEHRWGLGRLAERHPFRLALLAFLGGGAALGLAPESVRWLWDLLRAGVTHWMG